VPAIGDLLGIGQGLRYGLTSLASEGDGDCKLFGKQGTKKAETAVPGQFTVIVSLPAVGEFIGDTPDAIASGREFCTAVNMPTVSAPTRSS